MKRKYFVALLLSVFLLAGCGKEVRRQLVDQNRQAARFIQGETLSPPVKKAALDIEENSIEHAQWIGPPKEPKPYTPENSAAVRAESKKQRESSLWFKLKNFLGGIAMESILTAVMTAFSGWPGVWTVLVGGIGLWSKWRKDKQIMAGYEGINNILKTAKKGRSLSVEDIKSIVKDAQSAWNVVPIVRKDLAALQKKHKLSKVKAPPLEE